MKQIYAKYVMIGLLVSMPVCSMEQTKEIIAEDSNQPLLNVDNVDTKLNDQLSSFIQYIQCEQSKIAGMGRNFQQYIHSKDISIAQMAEKGMESVRDIQNILDDSQRFVNEIYEQGPMNVRFSPSGIEMISRSVISFCNNTKEDIEHHLSIVQRNIQGINGRLKKNLQELKREFDECKDKLVELQKRAKEKGCGDKDQERMNRLQQRIIELGEMIPEIRLANQAEAARECSQELEAEVAKIELSRQRQADMEHARRVLAEDRRIMVEIEAEKSIVQQRERQVAKIIQEEREQGVLYLNQIRKNIQDTYEEGRDAFLDIEPYVHGAYGVDAKKWVDSCVRARSVNDEIIAKVRLETNIKKLAHYKKQIEKNAQFIATCANEAKKAAEAFRPLLEKPVIHAQEVQEEMSIDKGHSIKHKRRRPQGKDVCSEAAIESREPGAIEGLVLPEQSEDRKGMEVEDRRSQSVRVHQEMISRHKQERYMAQCNKDASLAVTGLGKQNSHEIRRHKVLYIGSIVASAAITIATVAVVKQLSKRWSFAAIPAIFGSIVTYCMYKKVAKKSA